MPPKRNRAGNRKGGATAPKPSRQRARNERSSEYKTSTVSQVGFLRQQTPTSFGQAPPCEDYPEGGCRISGSSKMPLVSVGHISGNSLAYGGMVDAANASYCYSPVCLEYSPLATFNNLPSCFGVGLLNTAYQFEKYRVRKLVVRYVANCSSSTAARVTLTYSRDPFAAIAQTQSQGNELFLSADVVDDARISVSGSAWQSLSLDVIPMAKAQRDDELFFVDYYGGTGTQYSAGMRQSIQGAIGVQCAQQTSDATIGYGRIYLDYIIDMYGFNSGPISQVTIAAAARSEAKTAESKGDSKTPTSTVRDDNVKARGLDTDYELVAVKALPTPADRAQGRSAGSKDDAGTGWFRKA